jgi:signal transduction histidine kinase
MTAQNLPDRARPPLRWINPKRPVIDPLPLPMIEAEGPDHVVCSVNSAFCLLTGLPAEAMLGRRLSEILLSGSEGMAALDSACNAPGFGALPAAEQAEASSTCWLSALWPATGSHAPPVRFVIQLTRASNLLRQVAALNEALMVFGLKEHELRQEADTAVMKQQKEITDRKSAEAALQKAQEKLCFNAAELELTIARRTAELRGSVAELEAFSYTLAHDLRAPLRAIHGFTQLVLEMPDGTVAPSAVDLLNRVMRASGRMDSLIQDVLDLAQVIRRPIKLVPIDVDSLVRAIISERPELMPPAASIVIVEPLLPMLGHEASLSQCLTNLLGNAVKFVAAGQIPRVKIWSEPGAMVRLWIEDHGIGIPADAQDSIFEMFLRLHPAGHFEGSGIGLAIVRKAVERMGGQIGVNSTVGVGSRFWLQLPSC